MYRGRPRHRPGAGAGLNGIAIRRLTATDAQAYQALRLRGMAEHPEAFTSSADEEAVRPLRWAQDRLQADPQWVTYQTRSREAGHLLSQNSDLMSEAPFLRAK